MHYYTTSLFFSLAIVFLLLLLLLPPPFSCNALPKTLFDPFPMFPHNTTTTYIVHTSNVSRPPEFPSQTHWYNSILHSLANTTTNSTSNTSSATSAAAIVPRRILYTYRTLLHGFAATLSPQDALRVSRIPGVIGVYADRVLRLHTTRSPEFLGLHTDYGLWPESKFGEDVVVGLVDTGVWPESCSFDDAGLPPVDRSKWRGFCENGTRFDAGLCNNKLVGARFFAAGIEAAFEGFDLELLGEFRSPRDRAGHGTHTSSTAAGSHVAGANLFGFAPGTARGMAPRAKVAMYKACWSLGFCFASDVVAAIDAAVYDGVDVLSLSLGGLNRPYHDDPMAIATFAAVRRGVFVALSAGNGGPAELTVSNTEPWVLTVGAGSIDREFPANLTLGDGQVLVGESLYDELALHADMIPLVYLGYCGILHLVPDVVMGKIVVCDYADAAVGFYVQNAGGAGLISLTSSQWGEGIIVKPFPLPALTIGYSEALKLLSYINSTAEPVARLEFQLLTVIGEARAPKVASFSSRGPNPVVPEILKPDVIGPGLNILAAWPTETPLTHDGEGLDPRRVEFNIISGTSMSCPHLAGIAALLRQTNPRWSPAMIRSAIMTTAATLDNRLRPIAACENSSAATPLAIGAGLVRPQAARDPGLVYDAGEEDYVRFLQCALNYSSEELVKFSAAAAVGPERCGSQAGDLNYPSFAVVFGSGAGGAVRAATRTVTKVSEGAESYAVRIVNPRPDKVAVAVEPQRLEFAGGEWEERSYSVEFGSRLVDPDPEERKRREFGYIIWENEVHQVTSPVVFMWE
ncbi:Subtilisin-like protease SBT1.7 [Ananas comosus]|nr:Subtilisin-like protease SBT1.7 [Ananas comosus]